jgi:hypothetical protein
MKRTLAPAVLLLSFACTAPKPAPAPKDAEPQKEGPAVVTEAKDIRWEDECLVYPRQARGGGLQGSAIRRSCSFPEVPENISTTLDEGLAADEKTALALARVIVGHIYGEKILETAEPRISPKGDRWLVQWEIKSPDLKQDALKRLSVEVVKKTGSIARLWVSVVKE